MLVSMGDFGLLGGGGGGGGGLLADAIQAIAGRVGGSTTATRVPIPVPTGSPDPGPVPSQVIPYGPVPAAAIPAPAGPMLPPPVAPVAAAPAGLTILGQQVGIPTLVIAGGAAALGLFLLLRRRA